MTDRASKAVCAGMILDIITPLTHAANAGEPGHVIFDDLCRSLIQLGVPICRAALQVDNLNPVIFGSCFHWRVGEPAFEMEHTHAFADSDAFAMSP